MADGADWLRVRGLGRERFLGYVVGFLEGAGFQTTRTDSTEPAESRVQAHLARMNPSVPPALAALEFRAYPTAGGSALVWLRPTEVAPSDRARADRFARELQAHLERAVLTESHATAKVSAAPGAAVPWKERA